MTSIPSPDDYKKNRNVEGCRPIQQDRLVVLPLLVIRALADQATCIARRSTHSEICIRHHKTIAARANSRHLGRTTEHACTAQCAAMPVSVIMQYLWFDHNPHMQAPSVGASFSFLPQVTHKASNRLQVASRCCRLHVPDSDRSLVAMPLPEQRQHELPRPLTCCPQRSLEEERVLLTA
jgi:hypothetical protein